MTVVVFLGLGLLESFASAFDQPVDSPKHRALAEDGWMGGESITVRYWLGRLLQRNLFRESDEVVSAAMQQYFIDHGYTRGAVIASELQASSPLALVLRYHAELAFGNGPTKKPRLVAALEAVMENPERDDSQLAARANTTEKQIARMSDVVVLRKAWKHRRIGNA